MEGGPLLQMKWDAGNLSPHSSSIRADFNDALINIQQNTKCYCGYHALSGRTACLSNATFKPSSAVEIGIAEARFRNFFQSGYLYDN